MISDTHFGARSDNINILNAQKMFFDRVFFPIIEKEKPSMMIHLGDLVDNRNSLNFRTWDRMKTDFLDRISDIQSNDDFPVFYIVGNHDTSYKNTLSLNIQNLFDLGRIVDSPISIGGCDGTLIPWICNENREFIKNFVQNATGKYLFGHFELAGFAHGGTISKGDDPATLRNFEHVFSGHFHTKSKIGNIQYIGSAFALNWGDFGQWRGFNILDTNTDKITWYRNPFSVFSVINYNEDLLPENLSIYKDTYCRLFVVNKTSETKFMEFVSKIKDQGVIKLDIIEVEMTMEVDSSKIRFIDSEKDVFIEHIKGLDFTDQEGVESLFIDLYERARSL